MPAEIPCNGLCLVGGKDLVTNEMNVTLNILVQQRSFKSEIQIQNMMRFKTLYMFKDFYLWEKQIFLLVDVATFKVHWAH